jgi:hypothetical protein
LCPSELASSEIASRCDATGAAGKIESACAFVGTRAREEWDLLHRQWKMYVLCITVNIYGGSMVFRNLAFYRYIPGERLPQDIGFQMIPFYSGWH